MSPMWLFTTEQRSLVRGEHPCRQAMRQSATPRSCRSNSRAKLSLGSFAWGLRARPRSSCPAAARPATRHRLGRRACPPGRSAAGPRRPSAAARAAADAARRAPSGRGSIAPAPTCRPGGKGMAGHVGLALAHAALEERADAGADLPGLLGPADRPPLAHEIAERLDPGIGGGLAASQVEQPEPALRIPLFARLHLVVDQR